MAFRREVLLAVGGFDEFFDYNHDETDLIIRIMKTGGEIEYEDELLVYHFKAIGINRKSKYNINWYSDVKNNLYFGLKNGGDQFIVRLIRSFKRIFGSKGSFWILNKLLLEREISVFEYVRYMSKANMGLYAGLFGGIFSKRVLLS